MPPKAMSALMVPQFGVSILRSSASTKQGTLSRLTDRQRPVRAAGAGGDEAGRRIQPHDGLRLRHRDAAGFQQRGHDADAVAAGHGVGAVGLQHDEAGIGVGAGRRDQQVDRHLGAGARLQRHEPPQAVVDLVDVVHLVEHGRAGNLRRAGHQHLADLALAMDLDQLDRTREIHRVIRWQPRSLWQARAFPRRSAAAGGGASRRPECRPARSRI